MIAASRIPVYVALGSVFVLITVWEFWAGRRDQETRRAFAASIGATYEERDDSLLSSGFIAADSKIRKSCRDVIRGSRSGERFTLFRLVRTSAQWSTNTPVVMIDLPTDMPRIWMGRGRLFSSFAKKVGGEVLVGSEPFRRSIKVRCGDPLFASLFLDQGLQEWLLDQPWGPTFEAVGGHAFVVGGKNRASDAEKQIERAVRFASLISDGARTYRAEPTAPSGDAASGM